MAQTDIDPAAVFGISRARLDVLYEVARGPVSVSELMALTGLSRSGVWKHLRPLQTAGIVRPHNRPVASRFRPIVTFELDQAALEVAIWAVADVVTG